MCFFKRLEMILYRYFFKNLLLSLLSISAVFMGVLLLTQSVRFMEVLVGHTDTGIFKTLFKFIILLLPDILVLVLPFSMFFAILIVYNRFMWDRELTIMKAIGLSHFKLSIPGIGIGLCVMLCMLALNILVLPASNESLKDLEYSLKESTSISIIKEGEFNNFPGLTIYVREKGQKGEVYGIFAYIKPPEKQEFILISEKGFLKKEQDGEVYLFLYNGVRQETNKKTNQTGSLYFDQTIVSLKPSKKSVQSRSRKTSEFSLTELFEPDPNNFTQIDILKMKAEAHNRILTPLLALAYAFIGVTILLLTSFQRTGFVLRIICACCGVLVLQILSLVFINLATKIPSAIVILYLIILCVIGTCLILLNYSYHFLSLWEQKCSKKNISHD